MTYCIDTSGLIDAGVRYYPIQNFPSLWVAIEKLIAGGRLVAPEIVLHELTKKEEPTAAWAKQNSGLFVPMTFEIQEKAKSIVETYEGLVDPERERGAADPFVIATAMVRGFAVVSGETRRTKSNKPWRIPDVCDALNIRSMRVLDVIQAEGWKF